MNWRQLLKVLGSIALAAAGWIVAPIIDAKLKGVPLSGLSGVLDFWKRLIAQPIPVWSAFAAVLLVSLIPLILRKTRRRKELDLRIVPLSTPSPTWSFGAMGGTPVLMLRFHAKLAHRSPVSIEIVQAYLQGTKCEAPFLPLVVAGPYDPSVMIHFGVRPILAREGKELTKRVILVDQFGNKHRTKDPVTFRPTVSDPNRFGSAGPLKCYFCKEEIAMRDLSEAASTPAHKICIKQVARAATWCN